MSIVFSILQKVCSNALRGQLTGTNPIGYARFFKSLDNMYRLHLGSSFIVLANSAQSQLGRH